MVGEVEIKMCEHEREREKSAAVAGRHHLSASRNAISFATAWKTAV